MAIFLLLWGVTHVVYGLVRAPGILEWLPVDTDGFMRLVRVERLVETGNWLDGSNPRSNWPYGEVSHWTRPMDLLILALAAPGRLLAESRGAIAVAGILVSPLLHLAAALFLFRAARTLVPGPARALVLPLFLLQATVLSYGSLGRADHHMLILLLHVVLLGAGIRMLLEPGLRGPPVAAGLAAAAGIWVSPEVLLPLGLLWATQGLVWLLDGGGHPRAGVRLGLALAGGLAVALLVERPHDAVQALEYDRISRVHMEMALVAAAFWGVVDWRFSRGGGSARRRAGWLLLGGPAAVVAFVLARPRFIRGPWVDVDPEVVAYWLRNVQELRPLFRGPWWQVGPEVVLLLGHAIPALLFVLHRSFRGTAEERPGWLLLLVSLAAYLPLGVVQVRFTALSGPIQALAMAGLLGVLLRRQEGMARNWKRRFARVGTMAGVAAGPLLAAVGVAILSHLLVTDDAASSRGACSAGAVTRTLAQRMPEPSTVVAFMDLGPRILYETPHRVLATPYHRNRDGLLDARRIFRLPEGPELLALLARREVDFLLICPPDDRRYYDPPEGSLYDRIERSDLPSWLRAVPLPEEAGEFRLVELVGEMAGE